MEALRALTASDLREIAGAVRAGRLGAPYSATALQRHISSDLAASLSEELARMAGEGLQPAHLALFLELLAEERSQRVSASEAIDLVWTGPEASGITNRDTGVVVRELFSHAIQSVLVAGYAIHQGRRVFKALAERMGEIPELEVRMFLNVERGRTDTSLDSELVKRFLHRFKTKEWPGSRLPDLFYDPRSLLADRSERASLHAKCVVVDRRVAFVSSANFTEAAQRRNVEAGVLIRSAPFATKLSAHFDAMADQGILKKATGSALQ